jgi:hypothetical protein
MTASAPQGSIRHQPSSRPDLLTFEIVAKITEADIEWMATEVDRAFQALGEVDMLLLMRNYDGAELGAIFDGKSLAVQAKSLRHVRRYAVVGAPAWARAMIEAFSPVSPITAKTFDLDREADARAWVDEREQQT